jgi:hypothetical protein
VVTPQLAPSGAKVHGCKNDPSGLVIQQVER